MNLIQKKLLIVDDSKISRMFTRQHISAKYPDWFFVEATTGEEAVDFISKEAFDYCIMDINMPGMSGIEAAKIILDKHPQIKLIFFSATQFYQNEVETLGSILVQKPVTEKSISQILEFFGEV